jgi:DNA-binding NtrC family response regulator
LANDDVLRRALEMLRDAAPDVRQRSTLLLEELDLMPESLQAQLMAAIRQNRLPARIIGTSRRSTTAATQLLATTENEQVAAGQPPSSHAALVDAVSTITIDVPRLRDRLEDLPLLVQFFVEAENRDRGKQIGGVRGEVLDLLALYNWPGELAELRKVIAAAHRSATMHEITAADLPPLVHHASKAAMQSRRPPEPIVLDELLAMIEREAIVRALAQTAGNKTEAADLLGMTRPRLYRRLVQLGLAGPEFIEREAADETP